MELLQEYSLLWCMPRLGLFMSPEELQTAFDGLIALHKLDVRVDDLSFCPTGLWALDVEHDEQGGFVGCGFYNGGVSHYISDIVLLNHIDFSTLSLICHNGVSDFDCLRSWGIDVKDTQLYFDTQLMGHIIDSSRLGYGLKQLALADLGVSYPSYDIIVGKRTQKQVKERKTLDKWPVEIVSKYNAMDTFVTWKLYELQSLNYSRNRIWNNGNYFEDIERPLAFILSQMENRGICVDLAYLEGLKRELETQKQPIEAEIKNELGDINLNSPKQLIGALNEKGIYPTFKGKASTDKRALAGVQHPIVRNLLAYSELDTLLSSFVLSYIERGQSIVHPWFNQCGTRTGRLSCSNPNLLQIPRRTENGKKVRRMFIPRPGMLMGDCDFGQIEPRVMAHLSKDPVLCKMFNDGIDFHTYTAERLQINRDRAKVLNLSVGYRASKYSVQRQLGGTLEEAQEQIDKWWGLFPTLRRWQDKLLYDAKRSGFIITLLGLHIKVDGLTDGNPWKREAAERQAINNVTQGSAAEIMKRAMIQISQSSSFPPGFGLLVQVYDELLFEYPKEYTECSDLVKFYMERSVELTVPLTVEGKTGENWSTCH